MSEWRKVILSDIASFTTGKLNSNAAVENGKNPFFTCSPETLRIDNYAFEQEAILLAGNNAEGNFNIKYYNGKFNAYQRTYVFTAKDNCVLRFLFYSLKLCLDNFKRISQGTATKFLTAKILNSFELMLPNLKMQQQIASILSAIDDKIELNTSINENLEQQIQAILLNMIQQDSKKDRIETVKLGEYLYIKGRIGWKGLKKDEYLDSSDYRIINGESLTKDGIDWNKAGFISKERYDESPEIMLQVGDILLSKDGTIGKIGYVDNLDSPSTVASGIFVIRNIKPDIISTQFIYYLLKSKLFSAFIASRTEGSVIPHLYQKDFMEFAFPLPNADEMSQFDALTSPLFATVIKNLRENEFLTATRDALLPKLMNGEIDVSAVKI